MEVNTHGGGAAITGYERLGAVHAGRLFGGFVVRCFGEVEPNVTFGPTATVRQGGQSLGRSAESGLARSQEKRKALGSKVAEGGGTVSGVLRHGRLRELGCKRWCDAESRGRVYVTDGYRKGPVGAVKPETVTSNESGETTGDYEMESTHSWCRNE
jgi:hypothetical protein